MFNYMSIADLREEFEDSKRCYIDASKRGDSRGAIQFFEFMSILGEELDRRLGNK